MNDEDKTKKQLIMELTEMRRRVASLEALQAERNAVEKELRKSEASLAEAQRIAIWEIGTGILKTIPCVGQMKCIASLA